MDDYKKTDLSSRRQILCCIILLLVFLFQDEVVEEEEEEVAYHGMMYNNVNKEESGLLCWKIESFEAIKGGKMIMLVNCKRILENN